MDNVTDHQIKCASADFYQNRFIRTLLGDIFHPGGLELTHYLGETLGLTDTDIVLDLGSGRGLSTVYLAKTFNCQVTGLDFGQKNIVASKIHASKKRVMDLTNFQRGDSEAIPFAESTFDVVVSECSFCIFPDKLSVATEISRVLVPRGRLGMLDITLNAPLPEDFQNITGWVSCVSGANTADEYQNIFEEAGFYDFLLEDHQDALFDMVNNISNKLMNLPIDPRKLEVDGFNLEEAKYISKRSLELIETGIIGYTLIGAVKK